ncbi:hypothetical protein SAMN05444358_101271 [Ruegeria halocynthiae]|uniref:Uncharacterized protein n=1 Tax=Ruegeria halocynthiae TaxID=985054 RepID=A0A1H2RUU9_9RHOB|nr:hypothetical protein [Ruegeria halocynthiae]SDW22960.1 hypothetical protein SAMN05444358_101271 [Ruegeria halocynthiae]
MKLLPPILFLLAAAGCTNIPELEGRETAALHKAPYPELIDLDPALGPPADPISEAAEVEEDLIARSEALAKKAEALQNVEIE